MEEIKNEQLENQDIQQSNEIVENNENKQDETNENTVNEEVVNKQFDENDDKKKQDQKTNAEFAKKRREKQELERQQKELEHKAYLKAVKDLLDNGINPYTKTELKTDEDIEEYLEMREMEKQGLDPTQTQDYKKFIRDKQAKEKQKNEQEEFTKKSMQEFITKYPTIKINTLFEDSDFLEYAEGKNAIPLTKIYEGYKKIQDKIEQKAQELADKRIAKQLASPGSLTKQGGSDEQSKYFTMDQINKMSVEEIRKNMAKVDLSIAYHRKTQRKS